MKIVKINNSTLEQKGIVPPSKVVLPSEAENKNTFTSRQNEFALIQAAQARLDIQSEAAMPIEPISGGTIISIGAKGALTWLVIYLGKKVIEAYNKEVIEPLGDLYSKKLWDHFEDSEDRSIAIENIKDGELEDVPGMIEVSEKLLKQVLVGSVLDPKAKEELKKQQTLDKVTAVLEALYDSRTISESDNVASNSRKRGWQYNDLRYRLAEAVKFGNIGEAIWGGSGLSCRKDWANYSSREDCIAAILEEKHVGKFNDIVSINSQRSFERMLALNWNSPMVATNDSPTIYAGSMIPSINRSAEYRREMYETIRKSIEDVGSEDRNKDNDDVLGLKTPIDQIDVKKRKQVLLYRDAFLKAYQAEVALKDKPVDDSLEGQNGEGRYSHEVCKKMEDVLKLAKEIPDYLWEESAKQVYAKQKEREEKGSEFAEWGVNLLPADFNKPESVISKAFGPKGLSDEQVERIDVLRNLLKTKYNTVAELQTDYDNAFAYMRLELPSGDNRITAESQEKGLLFLGALSRFLFTEVEVAGNRAIPSEVIGEERLQVLRDNALNFIIHDESSFENLKRNESFFKNPANNTAPGLALQIHQKLFPIAPGTDKHTLLPKAVEVISENLYGMTEEPKGGFLLSGPDVNELSCFVQAVGDTMSMPVVTLTKGMISEENGQYFIKPGEDFLDLYKYVLEEDSTEFHELSQKRIRLVDFFHELDNIRANTVKTPVVLHMKEVHEYLVARPADQKFQHVKTDAEYGLTDAMQTVVESVRSKHNRRHSTLSIFMTTTKIGASDFDISSIAADGDSTEARVALLPFLGASVWEKGRIDHSIFTFHRGEPSAVSEPTEVNNQLAEKIDDIKWVVKSQVEVKRAKLLGEELDYQRLAEAALEIDVVDIEKIIANKTPQVLTNENVLEAFREFKDS